MPDLARAGMFMADRKGFTRDSIGSCGARPSGEKPLRGGPRTRVRANLARTAAASSRPIGQSAEVFPGQGAAEQDEEFAWRREVETCAGARLPKKGTDAYLPRNNMSMRPSKRTAHNSRRADGSRAECQRRVSRGGEAAASARATREEELRAQIVLCITRAAAYGSPPSTTSCARGRRCGRKGRAARCVRPAAGEAHRRPRPTTTTRGTAPGPGGCEPLCGQGKAA